MFKLIQDDVPAPQAVVDAIATLNANGYAIEQKSFGAVAVEIDNVDSELAKFIYVYDHSVSWGDLARGVPVKYETLVLLNNVADLVLGLNDNRAARHGFTEVFFGTSNTSHVLYRALGRFRNAFDRLDRYSNYSVVIK